MSCGAEIRLNSGLQKMAAELAWCALWWVSPSPLHMEKCSFVAHFPKNTVEKLVWYTEKTPEEDNYSHP